MGPPTVQSLLDEASSELRPEPLPTLTGADPILPTVFRIGEAAATALAALGTVIADVWRERTGRTQTVEVDVAHAALSLLSFALQRLDGEEVPRPSLDNPTVALYRAKDGRWIHLHGGFPHLHEGTLRVLGCVGERAAIARQVARWDARELEDTLAAERLCGALARTADEWAAHPQGAAVLSRPVVEVERVADSPPEPLPRGGSRPLDAIRVLDLTRVLAGPTCARTLAEHGADVLKITAEHLPSVPPFVLDTGHGKRSASLDLRAADDRARLRELVRDADVFSQGYRLGALERAGFGGDELTEIRPGIIYTSINCYGHEGPWSARPGWEQLAQTASGIAIENGSPDEPRLVPAAATDYITGYLAALGTLVALRRRARHGGSYRVRVSLAQTASWIQRFERADPTAAHAPMDRLAEWMEAVTTPSGELRYLRPATHLSETTARWSRPPAPLGTHDPEWLPRPSAPP